MNVSTNKTYRTKSGLRVINVTLKPLTDAGTPATFPIKGSIVVSEKPLKLRYEVWTSEGKIDVINNGRDHLDLVESKE